MGRRIALPALTLALSLSCASPAPLLRPPKQWHPDASTRMFECTAWHPTSGEYDDLQAQCARRDAPACFAFAIRDHASYEEKAWAAEQVRPFCAKYVCGCWLLGELLSLSNAKDAEIEGMEVTRAACVRGSIDACESVESHVRRCAGDGDDYDYSCQALRDGGRIRAKAKKAPFGQAMLEPAFTGCFTAVNVTPGRPPRGRAESICDLDPTACERPESAGNAREEARAMLLAHEADGLPVGEPGVVHCFEMDRYSVRSKDGVWNQRLTTWLTDLDDPTVFTSPLGLSLSKRDGGLTMNDARGGVAMLAPMPEMGRELEVVERVEKACPRARRCVEAAEKAAPDLDEAPDGPAGPPLPNDLLGCQEMVQAARKRVAARGGSMPDACW